VGEASTEPVLEVADVHTWIGQHHILQGVSLRIGRGQLTVLLGRNGAGKTTTLRTIVGLLHPARGAIRYHGTAIHRLPPYDVVRLGIGYVPEGQGIFASLTVDENLRVAMWHEDAASRERRDRMLALFPDLARYREARAGTLSGGQKQMLAIARAFVNDNRLVLVDEPSKGLAPIVVEHLIEGLRTIKQQVTVLLVEQNFAMAAALADHFYLLDDGRTVHQGPMEALVHDHALKKRYLGV
jgi:branched-chain amino acid transport system ATP-binding protein